MAREPKGKAVVSPQMAYGQIGMLYNSVIPFDIPYTFDTNIWRAIARRQPVIMDCISTIIMRTQSLPWAVRAKDAEKTDELRDEIEEHERIILKAGKDGYLNHVDLLFQEYYISPFGGASEVIRYSDGRLFGFQHLDSATLYPNPNPLIPVIQKVGTEVVSFKEDEIVRIYQSPRPELERSGWGMTPVEKVYLAIELLARGDRYYAQLLLDTPEAGLLDLGDMSKESAEKWLESFRGVMTGIDAFKIPVIYQHTTEAKWIPFGRPPTDMLFDSVTYKYAQLVCAAFGLTGSDIGLVNSSGGSLSGQIREERHSRSTGFASAKAKLTEYFNKILPEYLEFVFIDTDDELLVSKGRARSANAVAGRNLIESGAITPQEWRKQLQADGLITIPLQEEPDEQEFEILKEIDGTAEQLDLQKEQLELQKKQQADAAKNAKLTQKQNTIGGGRGRLNKQRNVRGGKLEQIQGKEPVAPSQGGQGEIKSETTRKLQSFLDKNFSEIKEKLTLIRSRKIVKTALKNNYQTLSTASKENDNFTIWKSEYFKLIFGQSSTEDEIVKKSVSDQIKSFSDAINNERWWEVYFDETELGDILAESYLDGLRSSAIEIQAALYEDNLVNTPDVNKSFELNDSEVLNEIYAYAATLALFINSGTDYYINRLSLASVAEAADIPIYVEKLKSGVTLEELLEDDEFINSASQIFSNNFEEILNSRIHSISIVENSKMFNKGVLKQYSEVGFTKKALRHLGSDEPCEICKDNEGLGFVDLEYKFKSKFGDDVLVPPLHPECHHVLTFSRSELKNIKTNFYTGE